MNAQRARLILAWCLIASGTVAMADDVVSFATGGYASALRTPSMMHKIDTDGNGRVSEAEWNAYQTKLFDMLDADHSGALDEKEFMHAHEKDVASFATGGFATELRTSQMLAKLDADHDGSVTREEFLTYQSKLFNMMDTGKKHELGQNEFFGRGPAH